MQIKIKDILINLALIHEKPFIQKSVPCSWCLIQKLCCIPGMVVYKCANSAEQHCICIAVLITGIHTAIDDISATPSVLGGSSFGRLRQGKYEENCNVDAMLPLRMP